MIKRSFLKFEFIENKLLRNFIMSMSFYGFMIVAAFILNVFDPGGPCTPGIGILVFLILLPASIVLFARNVYLYFKDSSHVTSLAVHLVVIMGFVILRFLI